MDKKKKSQGSRTGAGTSAVSGKKWIPIVAVVSTLVLLAIVVFVVARIFNGDDKVPTAKNAPEATYDPLQCVELGQYIGVKMSLGVTEEDVQTQVESLLEEHAIYEQLDGTVEEGDLVFGDFEGYVNGQKMDITSGSDYIEVGSGEWVFENGLIGAVTGQTVVFTVPVPAGYFGSEEVDGKDVEYHVTVQYICGDEILPDYNDEFVQSISKKYKTTEEYNQYIRKQERKENEEQKAEFVWSEVMEGCKVKKYPESLVEASGQEVLQGYYDMAVLSGCTREEVFPMLGYESEQDFIDSDLEELAKDTAKEYLISQAIAAKEGIAYTQEEYEKFKTEEYSDQEGQYDTIELFEKEKKGYLENQLLLQKVKEWIAERAEFTE